MKGERHAYDEPVSRMTLKETGGVPIANDPKYLRGALGSRAIVSMRRTYVKSLLSSVSLYGTTGERVPEGSGYRGGHTD